LVLFILIPLILIWLLSLLSLHVYHGHQTPLPISTKDHQLTIWTLHHLPRLHPHQWLLLFIPYCGSLLLLLLGRLLLRLVIELILEAVNTSIPSVFSIRITPLRVLGWRFLRDVLLTPWGRTE
jgi:hypothetical protein